MAGLESVAWVGIFQPAYKLSPSLKREGTNLYRVRVERGADYGLTTAAIVSSGHRVSLETAIRLTLACTPRYRLPETTRQAHRLASG